MYNKNDLLVHTNQSGSINEINLVNVTDSAGNEIEERYLQTF